MSKRFLVVSPHPDDAELGLGGTIIKSVKRGHKVYLVDLTSGEPTPYGTQKKRMEESEEASRILGIEDRINLGFENRYLFDSKEVRLMLAEKIRIYRPDILFCPYPEDAHPDHIACTKITEAARFYAKFSKITLKGKPHYPFYLFYYFCAHLRRIPDITFFVNISLEFKKKMKAVRCYHSQFIANPPGRFIFEYLETQNRFLGLLIQEKYAEAIYSKEAIKIDDLADIL